MSKEITSYIPFGGGDIDLGEGMITPAPEYPLLQYATGLPARRPKLDAQGQQLYDEDTGEALVDNIYYAGFFTMQGKDEKLDEAMEKNGIPWLDIVHGNGDVVRHWALERPVVFLIAMGIPTNANSNGSMGMVYMWRTKRNSQKKETVLYAHIVLRQLLPNYTKPFVFTIKSTQTTDALNAMRRNFQVIAAAGDMLRRAGRKIVLPLWSYSLTLGASRKQENRGQEGASKAIFPVASYVPNDISPEYLQRHEVPLEYIDHFRELTRQGLEWAQSLSQRIAEGIEGGETVGQIEEEKVDLKSHFLAFNNTFGTTAMKGFADRVLQCPLQEASDSKISVALEKLSKATFFLHVAKQRDPDYKILGRIGAQYAVSNHPVKSPLDMFGHPKEREILNAYFDALKKIPGDLSAIDAEVRETHSALFRRLEA
jgi:hypothetical protein